MKEKESSLELIFGFYVSWAFLAFLFSGIFFFADIFSESSQLLIAVLVAFPFSFWWDAPLRKALKEKKGKFRLWFLLSLVFVLMSLVIGV